MATSYLENAVYGFTVKENVVKIMFAEQSKMYTSIIAYIITNFE